MIKEQLDSDFIPDRKVRNRVAETVMKICLMGYLLEGLMIYETMTFVSPGILICFATPYPMIFQNLLFGFILAGVICFFFLFKNQISNHNLNRKLLLATPFIQVVIFLLLDAYIVKYIF